MAERRNFLLGRGENLMKPIDPPAMKPNKAHPYSFDEAVQTARAQLAPVIADIDALPAAACPRDEAVMAVTLHPAYLAKSYFPDSLLKKAHLHAIGSRKVTVQPRRE
jgi:hypothetical protein